MSRKDAMEGWNRRWKFARQGKKKEKGGTLSQMIVVLRINIYMTCPLVKIILIH